jgi:hypothetical protein
MILTTLIAQIKQKRELQEISDEVVAEQLNKYLQQHPKANLTNPRSAEYKQALKEIRAKLRRQYGLFRQEKLDASDSLAILKSHSSTQERFPFYPEIYAKIFALTGRPKIILDLGCGVNPLSVEFMHLKQIEYYAYDISEKEVQIINDYFRQQKIRGEAQVLDVSKIDALKILSAADVCFLFKITDILDRGKGHKQTEEVLQAVPAKYVVISFPTKTMSGRPMTAPRRKWMEWLCQRLGCKYWFLEFGNELFYVVRKPAMFDG